MAQHKAIQNVLRSQRGTLVTGGFRLLDEHGNVIKEGHLPNSPRVEVPVDFSEVEQ
jgi:hypothetical protein